MVVKWGPVLEYMRKFWYWEGRGFGFAFLSKHIMFFNTNKLDLFAGQGRATVKNFMNETTVRLFLRQTVFFVI